MGNIVAFESAVNLPAHFLGVQGMSLNDAAEEFASNRFPILSVKNGRFSIKRDGEKTLVMTDRDEPATYVEVAILNLQKSKTYYADGWVEGSASPPDCSSDDGITPRADSPDMQCTSCALCPQNAWGTGVNQKGEATKGKACSDVQRVAISRVDSMNDPMMLRVPPASLKNLAEMSKALSKKGVPLNGVVVRISPDTDAVGVLNFKPVDYLDPEQYATAKSMQNTDLVLAIIGRSNRGVSHVAEAPVTAAKLAKPKPVEVDPAIAKAAAKAAKIAAALKAIEDEEDDGSATTIETPAPVPPTKPSKSATKVADSGNFDKEMADILG